MKHLLIVPGHALLKDETKADASLIYYKNKNHWQLADHQENELSCYLEHIKAGLLGLKEDPNSLLVFSGGRTRPGQKKWSKAGSYLSVARAMPEWKPEYQERTLTEDHARDSLKNLCFSYFRYFIETGHFPKKISIFGFTFKSERFDWHRNILGLPSQDFEYIKVNNPPKEKMQKINKDELAHLIHYKNDPYGLSIDLMVKKRHRNPHDEESPYLELIKKLSPTVDLKALRQSINNPS